MTVASRPLRAGATALVVILGAGGCASASDGQAASTAEAFGRAVADADGARACGLLATRTRSELEQSTGQECSRAVLDEARALPHAPRDVQVFGTMAQVDFGSDTLFLSRYDAGWRVVAAACTPGPTTYDCAVEAG